jgi:hypothetical protein
MQEGLKKAVENNLKWNERGVDSEISEWVVSSEKWEVNSGVMSEEWVKEWKWIVM